MVTLHVHSNNFRLEHIYRPIMILPCGVRVFLVKTAFKPRNALTFEKKSKQNRTAKDVVANAKA